MMKFSYLLILPFFFTITAVAQGTQKDSTKHAATVAAEDFKDDWAALSHYQKENALLGLPKKGEKRVVFLGSSILFV